MTYNVFSGTLNPTHFTSLHLAIKACVDNHAGHWPTFLVIYYVGAVKLKCSAVPQLSVCWNDAFRRIFYFMKSESVRLLQVNFDTLDLQHLYDIYRWKFIINIGNKCTYWSKLVKPLDMQYREVLYIADRYRPNTACTKYFVVLNFWPTLVYCGQTAGWIKMKLGMEAGLGPGHIVLDGHPAPPQGAQPPPNFGPCPLCPNGWMD